VEFVPSTATPNISGGIRTVALIGTGKTTKTLTANLIRGTSAAPLAPGAPDLASALPYAILAGSTVTNTGATTLTGDLGLYPGTSVTGFPPGTLTGTENIANSLSQQAQVDALAAYTNLALRVGATDETGNDLNTITGPGTYKWTSSAALTGTMTLTGSSTDVVIFQIGTTLTTGSTPAVVLVGILPQNVFWQVGTSATLGGGTFQGTLLANTSISVSSACVVTGQLFALNGAVTIAAASSITDNLLEGAAIDVLLPHAFSLPSTITDANYVNYTLGIDYTLVDGNVDWLTAPATLTSNLSAISGLAVSGLTFIVSINGGTPLTTTFTGSNPVSQASIISQMNATTGWSGQVHASAFGNFIILSNTAYSANPGPVNTIQTLGGTANAALGFIGGLIAKGPQQPSPTVGVIPGTAYSFSYQSPKVSADYVPTVYYDLQDLINDMGPIPTDTATPPAVYNLQSTDYTLPLGAQVVFQNSANSGAIVAMQLNPADQPALTGFQNALNKLLAVPNINIVVCLTADPNLYPAILGHITNASAPLEGNFRTAIVGMNGNPSIATAIGYAAGFAAGGNGRRILLAYPPAAAIPGTNGAIMTDGSFIAAAIAGLRINSNYDVAEPLLRKELQGIDSIPANLLRSQKLALRNGGVTVVETVNGIIRVMEDTTTDRSTVDAENYSVTEIIDFVAESTQSTLNNLFIGIKLLTDTPSMIVTTLNLLLSTFVDLQIINGFTNVSATVNSIDPSQIDVSFDIAPVFPLRYISVTFSI
jgi:hypothetical protein